MHICAYITLLLWFVTQKGNSNNYMQARSQNGVRLYGHFYVHSLEFYVSKIAVCNVIMANIHCIAIL